MFDSAKSDRRLFDRVLLVVSSEELRRLMRSMLEFTPGVEVCGEAAGLEDCLQKILSLKPHLLVLDLSNPHAEGLESVHRMIEEFPEIPIVVVSGDHTRAAFETMREVGIEGYLLRSEIIWKFAIAVRSVLDGGRYFPAPDFFGD
jgi:two-component system invasion response regulator UvrY